MSEPIRKPEQTNPEGYGPKTPVIAGMMGTMPIDNTVNGEEVPYLFKKEIIRLPKSLLVGKKVTYPIAKQGVKEEDGGNPHLSKLWDACGRDGTHEWCKAQKDTLLLDGFLGLYYDINANDDGNFSYLVGSLMKADTAVPEGFAAHELPESEVALCWFKYGADEDVWAVGPHGVTDRYVAEQGCEGLPTEQGGWCSEFYPFGEFPNGDGYNILGYLIACRKKESE